MTAMAGSVQLRSGGDTNEGRSRTRNEDYLLVRDDLGLWAVADGMGGHQGGDVASQLTCETLERSFRDHTVAGLLAAIREANLTVYDQGGQAQDLAGMGTTVVVVAEVADDQGRPALAVTGVGDSRVYRLAADDPNGALDQLTDDHSLVAEMMRNGQLTPEAAAIHPQRNIVTRVIGVDPDVEIPVPQTYAPQLGDRYLLCSDGLFNEVPESVIVDVLRQVGDPKTAASELVRLANEAGGRDNITVVVVEVVDRTERADTAGAQAEKPTALAGQPHPSPAGPTHDAGPATDEPERPAKGRHRARKPRRLTFRVVAFVILLLAVVAGAIGTIQWYGRNAYFIGFDDNDQVAIFKGRPGGVLWVQPELVEPIELHRDDVPGDTVRDLDDGQTHSSLRDARATVENLVERVDPDATADPDAATRQP